MAKSKLRIKQRRFIEEYLIDPNATKAAIRAGYSEKTAQQMGSENLSKPVIAEALAIAQKERADRVRVTADSLLAHCSDMLNADIGDILDEVGAFKSIHDWPKIWRQMVSGIDIKELFEWQDNVKKKTGEVAKMKFITREKLIELTGKHIGVRAFDLNGDMGDTEPVADEFL